MNRLAVGLGMIPRGEVGLIFANQGLKLKLGGESIVDGSTYTAIVMMVIATTLVTPPLLTAAMRRGEAPKRSWEADREDAPPAE